MSIFGTVGGGVAPAQIVAFLFGAVLVVRLVRFVVRTLGLGA